MYNRSDRRGAAGAPAGAEGRPQLVLVSSKPLNDHCGHALQQTRMMKIERSPTVSSCDIIGPLTTTSLREPSAPAAAHAERAFRGDSAHLINTEICARGAGVLLRELPHHLETLLRYYAGQGVGAVTKSTIGHQERSNAATAA